MPLVSDVLDQARALLADVQVPGGETFTNAVLLPFFQKHYRAAFRAASNLSVPKMERGVQYTLPAGTLTLTPATIGVTDFREPIRVEERGSAADGWCELDSVTDLEGSYTPQIELRRYRWRGDTFQFIGATTDRLLYITYDALPVAPTSVSSTISPLDDAQDFLATATAGEAGSSRDRAIGQRLSVEAYGPQMQANGSGGMLSDYLSSLVKTMQRTRYQRGPFNAFRS